jgi:hypothetical protein
MSMHGWICLPTPAKARGRLDAPVSSTAYILLLVLFYISPFQRNLTTAILYHSKADVETCDDWTLLGAHRHAASAWQNEILRHDGINTQD